MTWQTVNQTPHAVDRAFARDRDGAELWMVAVKATYDVRDDGSLTPAREPEAVHLAPVHHGDPAATSLRYDSELAPFRCGVDVLVHGHAHAPGGRPVPHVDVALRVAGRTRAVRVFGERVWEPTVAGLAPSRPRPFTRMPVVYERAFGGRDPRDPARFDERNPVGVGYALDPDALLGAPAHNLEDPASPVTAWRRDLAPVGLGPIPRHWHPRARRGGTFDARWEAERAPLWPDDLQDVYFSAAPDAQRFDALREGEAIELLNLTPSGYLRVALPRERPSLRTRIAGRDVLHGAWLRAVTLEPEVPRVLVLWNAVLRVHFEEHLLESTTVRMKKVL